jgi:hypothetical protein
VIESYGKNVCVGVFHGKMRFMEKYLGILVLIVSMDRKIAEKGKVWD